MKRNFYIPFLICLFSLNVFSQSKFNIGLTLERGFTFVSEENSNTEILKRRYRAIGIPIRYQLNEKIDLRTTIKRSGRSIDYRKIKGLEPDIETDSDNIYNEIGSWEVILGIDYKLVSRENFKLIYSPAVNFSFFNTNSNRYFGYVRTSDSINFYYDLTYRNTDPFQVSVSNGIKFRLKDQWDLGLTLNTGFYKIASSRSDYVKLEHKEDPLSQVPDNFKDDPDIIYKNSYLSFSVIYWPLRGEERKTREAEYNLDRKNAFYIEALGPMYYYSLNYDRILLSTAGKGLNFRIAGRAGANYMDMFDKDDINVLLGFSLLLGYKGHYLETGGGALRTFHETDENLSYAFLGYRKQKDLVFARAGINLNFYSDSYDGNQFLWPSFGIGIAF